MLAELKKLWQYRELLLSMVNRDLKVRYKNSVLGFFWSLINPLLTVFVITFMFLQAKATAVNNFSAYVLAAYLPYMFFSMSIMDSTGSVLANLGIVKKIYFPREILPLTAIISNFVHFLLALVVFFAYLLVIWVLHPGEVPFQATTIYLPILLIISFLMSAGMGLFLSALNTFYEDVKYMVGFFTSMLLFLSPIMFMDEQYAYGTPRRYLFLKIFNPVGDLCNAYRKILLAPTPVKIGDHSVPAFPLNWLWVLYAGCFSVIFFALGYLVFNRYKWKFVERP